MKILFALEFENLGKAFSKAKSVIEKEGNIPQFFIRGLADLEDFVKEVSMMNKNWVELVKFKPLLWVSRNPRTVFKNLFQSESTFT